MSNALVSLEPKDLTELKGVAQVFAESGLFKDAKGMAQAFVKIMAGREIGIGAFAAMQGIYIVDGKPTYSANIMASAIKRGTKYDYRVIDLTNERCEIAFYQDGEQIGLSVLTMAEAKTAKMDQSWDRDKNEWKQKPTWKNFPKNMLFARAMSNGVRWYCPDVFDMPVYTPDEMGADIDDENIIDGTIIEDAVAVVDPEPTPASNPRRMPIEDNSEPVQKTAEPEKKTKPELTGDDRLFNGLTLAEMIDYTIERSADIEAGDKFHGGGRLYKAVSGKDGKPTWTPGLFKDLGLTVGQAKNLVDAYIANKQQQPVLMDESKSDKVVGGTCKECGDPTNRKDFLGEWLCEDCAAEAADLAAAEHNKKTG